ncbi:MAG: lipopolysaccharide biosynthesis protein [Acidobacteriota bacterium]|nr:lipopolysaccharide biosynthesis protein [Acidobacteriota bacterium]
MIGKLNIASQASAPEREHFRTEHLRADLGARTARGGAVMVGAQGLKFVINIGSTAILARLLTPHDYGLIGMVVVVTGFITLFKSMGLSAATMQRAEINDAQVSTLFWINVAVGFLLFLVTAAAAPGAAWFFGEPSLTWITAALGFAFVFGGLSVQHEALLKRQMRFAALAAADTVSMVGGISVALALAWYGAGYWALVANQLVLAFVYCVGVWAACRWRPGRPVRGAGVRAMLAFGRDITGQGVFIYFARNLDNLLIGRVWGAAQLALYAKAYQLLLLPMEQLSTPLNGVALPALSRLHDSPERYRRAYLRLLEKVAMFTMPGVAFMIVTSDWLVRVVLGPQWDESARIFMLLGFVGLLEPVANTLGWLLLSQGRTRHMLQWGVINGTITSASIIAGLPWGAVGVAASYSLVGLCVRKPLVFWFVGRSGPVRVGDFYRTIAPSALAALAVMLTLFGFRRLTPVSNHLLGLAVSSALALAVTLLIFLALPRGRRALQDIKELFPLVVKRAA